MITGQHQMFNDAHNIIIQLGLEHAILFCEQEIKMSRCTIECHEVYDPVVIRECQSIIDYYIELLHEIKKIRDGNQQDTITKGSGNC